MTAVRVDTVVYDGYKLHVDERFVDTDSSEQEPTLGLALANRSAALVHLKQFRMAISDVQLALQSAYPSNQRYKLYERIGYCYQQLGESAKARVAYNVALNCVDQSQLDEHKIVQWKNSLNQAVSKLDANSKKPKASADCQDSAPTPPPLLTGPNPHYPNASQAIALHADPRSGRFFKATQDIKPAQTLVRTVFSAFARLILVRCVQISYRVDYTLPQG